MTRRHGAWLATGAISASVLGMMLVVGGVMVRGLFLPGVVLIGVSLLGFAAAGVAEASGPRS